MLVPSPSFVVFARYCATQISAGLINFSKLDLDFGFSTVKGRISKITPQYQRIHCRLVWAWIILLAHSRLHVACHAVKAPCGGIVVRHFKERGSPRAWLP